MYYHFGELPGFNSFSAYDPVNTVTLALWSNLTVAPHSRPTANVFLVKVVDQIYTLPSPTPPVAVEDQKAETPLSATPLRGDYRAACRTSLATGVPVRIGYSG